MKLRVAILLLATTMVAYSGRQVLAQQQPTAVLLSAGAAAGYNASLGSTVTFTCIISGTSNVLWFVNGSSEYDDRGIRREPTVALTDGTSMSRINVPATAENDGIEIFCLAVTISVNGQSETVTLLIQGLLSSPTALNISDQNNGTTRLLNWTPPPTLDLTDVDPDITHYNVCSTILSEVSCMSVQGTEFSFANIRIEIEFSVAAVNVVGEGNASTISHEPCNSTTGTLPQI